MLQDPERAEKLFNKAEMLAAEKYAHLQKLIDLYSMEEKTEE